MKISDFGKFLEYITDSVRPVQQNSRHLVDIISKISRKIHFNIHVFIYSFHMPLFIISWILTDLFSLKISCMEQKSIARDWISHVTCVPHGLKYFKKEWWKNGYLVSNSLSIYCSGILIASYKLKTPRTRFGLNFNAHESALFCAILKQRCIWKSSNRFISNAIQIEIFWIFVNFFEGIYQVVKRSLLSQNILKFGQFLRVCYLFRNILELSKQNYFLINPA